MRSRIFRAPRSDTLPLLGLVLILISLTTLYTLLYSDRDRILESYRTALSDAQVTETVTFDNVVYVVARGHVSSAHSSNLDNRILERALLLAYQKAAARRSPIFHIAGTDTSALHVIADSLDNSRKQLAEKQGDLIARVRVGHIFPVEFLRSLATLENARQQFLLSGNEDDARAYTQQLTETLQEYRRALGHFERNFEHSVSIKRPAFASGRDAVDRETLLATVRILQEQTAKTAAHIRARNWCFNGHIENCDLRDIAVPTITPVLRHAQSEDRAAHTKSVRIARKGLGAYTAEEFRTLSIAESACLPANYDVPLHFGFPPDIREFHGIQYERPTYAGDIFLLAGSSLANVPFFDALKERGATFVPVLPLAYYKCVGLDHDLGILAAMRHVYEFAETENVSQYLPESARQNIVELEKLLARPVVEQSDVYEYLIATLEALRDGFLPEDVGYRLLELSLEVRDKSVGTYHAALDAAYLTEMTLALNDEGIPTDLSADYLYFTRSGFPTLYMAHNPSATGIFELPFPRIDVPTSEQPYILFSDLMKTFDTNPELRVQLAHDIQLWRDLHVIPQ